MIDALAVSDGTGVMLGSFDLTHFRESVTSGSRVELPWVIAGLSAQGLFLLCLVGQWIATRRRGRMVLPAPLILLGIFGTLVLLIYASIRHDFVFVVGQLVNLLIGFRMLEIVAVVNEAPPRRDETPFPEVKPDTAERKRRV